MDKTLSLITPKLSGRKKVLWIVFLLITVSIMCIPCNEAFTFKIKLFLAGTVLAILIFAFDLLNQTITAIALPLFYAVTGLADTSVIFSPWSQSIIWQMLGGFIVANTFIRIGLLKRIASKCIMLTGGSYKGLIFGIGIAGIVLNIVIPGNAIIPLAAFAFGVVKSLGLKKSREASAIMVASAVASLMPLNIFFSSSYFLAGVSAQEVFGPLSISWPNFLWTNLPMLLIYILFFLLLPRIFKPEQPLEVNKEVFSEELKSMGKLSGAEKKALIICLIIFIYFLTSNLHHMDVMWGFVFGAILLFVPGINIGSAEDVTHANYSVIFFAAACMGIGSVASALGIGKLVINLLLPVLSGVNQSGFLILTWLFLFVCNFLMTPISMYTTFGAPLAGIAVSMGIHPDALLFTMLQGGDAIILPYEYSLYLLVFAFGGMTRLKDWAKMMSFKVIISFLGFLLLLLPFWHLIGLIQS